MLRVYKIILLALLIASCARNSGVVPYGENQYLVSRQAATGFHGMGNLKAEALQEANNHCISLGKKVNVIKEEDSKPPYILGNFPRTEIYFECLEGIK